MEDVTCHSPGKCQLADKKKENGVYTLYNDLTIYRSIESISNQSNAGHSSPPFIGFGGGVASSPRH